MANIVNVLGAVQRDDPVHLEELLQDKGAVLDASNLAKGLQLAAQHNYEECVRLLLETKAPPDVHDNNGVTPLISACKGGHWRIVKMLLNSKSSPNKCMRRIRATALHWAATYGHIDCAVLLIDAGAKVDAKTANLRTPLMLASRSGHQDIVELLLDRGADVSHNDFERATALHFACEEGNSDCVRKLLKGDCNINAQTRSGDTPVILATKRGHTEVLRLLMRQIPVNLKLKGHKMSVLHWAAEGGHIDCIKVLINYGMDPNVETSDSYYGIALTVNKNVTPLMLASRGGYSLCCQVLIDAGAILDIIDLDGNTALHYAIKSDFSHVVDVLVLAGADINGRIGEDLNNDGQINEDEADAQENRLVIVPVAYAVRRNSLSCLRSLLRANCKLDSLVFTDLKFMSVFEYALNLEHYEAVKMLICSGYVVEIVNREVFELGMSKLCQKNEVLFQNIVDTLTTPQSLMELCRGFIRGCLGSGVTQNVSELPLPKFLLDYLDLKELDVI